MISEWLLVPVLLKLWQQKNAINYTENIDAVPQAIEACLALVMGRSWRGLGLPLFSAYYFL